MDETPKTDVFDESLDTPGFAFSPYVFRGSDSTLKTRSKSQPDSWLMNKENLASLSPSTVVEIVSHALASTIGIRLNNQPPTVSIAETREKPHVDLTLAKISPAMFLLNYYEVGRVILCWLKRQD